MLAPSRLALAVILLSTSLAPATLASAAAPPAPASPATLAVPVPDPGFETDGSWAPPAQIPPGATVGRDAAARHAGATSLRLANTLPASVSVLSGPVALKVGRVYRLSAWVKTEKAAADPLARYPTAVAACVAMDSFPYTNCSPSAGGTRDWTRVTTLFVALKSKDRVSLHLGRNGNATGTAWFDDVVLEELSDIREFLPLEAVKWAGPGFRYDDKGWIFVHVEGEPYSRGVQYGTLVADEIAEYIRKVSTLEDPKNPAGAWAHAREMTDALFLRKYEEEFLVEMQGIAAGAAKAGAKVDGRPVDLLDVVTVNSVVDLDYVSSALRVTRRPLTGRSFLSAEEELKIPEGTHKCSALAATGPATADGRVVFGQLFMWAGYTGVHFNVICDVAPTKGHRLVYQTFPGGIHSGTDFYMNSAGIILGETTVAQTPFNPDGSTQSNRIRKAAQYASSIDEAVAILRKGNNGLYTNDWPMADVRKNEAAVFLLGTNRDKLWRSTDVPAPFGSPGFLWANNNARDPEVRKEYGVQPDDAPFDAVFAPWDRDLAFRRFWHEKAGKIDLKAMIEAFSSSPINRPHACDGKITTAEMAEEMVFIAHQGKTTLREKFPVAGSRRMPDLPGAIPHLTYGWTAFSPVWITEKLKEARRAAGAPAPDAKAPTPDLKEVEAIYKGDKAKLWKGSVFPATDADGALASATTAYWAMLNAFGDDAAKNRLALKASLADLGTRWHWVAEKEGDVVPSAAKRSYEAFGPYRVSRVKGTVLLHQLRLMLGPDDFLKGMTAFHAKFSGKEFRRADFTAAMNEATGRDVAPLVAQWLDRAGLPDPKVSASVREETPSSWVVQVEVEQPASPAPWRLFGTVSIEAGGKELVRRFEANGAKSSLSFPVAEKPVRVTFDSGDDFPAPLDRWQRFGNFSDDWTRTTIVHGTSRQLEANRTLALRWQATLADAISEILPPVVPDGEADEAQLASRDLLLLGPPSDNSASALAAARLKEAGVPLEFGPGWFRFRGKTYSRPDDGVVVSAPNPWNPKRGLTLVAANSPLELHQMTKGYVAGLAPWAIYRGEEAKEQGYFAPARFTIELDAAAQKGAVAR